MDNQKPAHRIRRHTAYWIIPMMATLLLTLTGKIALAGAVQAGKSTSTVENRSETHTTETTLTASLSSDLTQVKLRSESKFVGSGAPVAGRSITFSAVAPDGSSHTLGGGATNANGVAELTINTSSLAPGTWTFRAVLATVEFDIVTQEESSVVIGAFEFARNVVTVITHVTIVGSEGTAILTIPSPDSTPPTTTAQVSANADPVNGWYNAVAVPVTLTLSATDNPGGSGVNRTEYSLNGGASWTTYGGPVTFSTDGTHTVLYRSVDNADNVENNPDNTLTIRIDTIAPTVVVGAPDGLWHASDVSIGGSASDSGSGLANEADASFSLSTLVPAGTETNNAATNSLTICDVAGNCAQAGPISGNMVDKKAAEITITSPTNNARYLLNESVAASYSATDGGSGVASVIGTVPSGSSIDTASVGIKRFSVNAADNVGNVAAPQSVSYKVGYKVVNLTPTPPVGFRSGSVIPIKVQLYDANGVNVSSSSIIVTALGGSSVGNANPDGNFRYEDGHYVYNLSTKGLAAGSYSLIFQAGADPDPHAVPFQVK